MKTALTAIVLAVASIGCSAQSDVDIHATQRTYSVAGQVRSIGQGKTLIVGDSIVEGFWWNTLCGGPVINGGSNGANTKTVLNNIDVMLSHTKAKVVVVSIGVNDASNPNWNWGVWAADYISLVEKVAATGATVILETVLPVESGKSLGSTYFNTSTIQNINLSIRGIAAQHGYLLNDQWNTHQVNGYAPVDATADGVHPNHNMYLTIKNNREVAVMNAWARLGKTCSGE